MISAKFCQFLQGIREFIKMYINSVVAMHHQDMLPLHLSFLDILDSHLRHMALIIHTLYCDWKYLISDIWPVHSLWPRDTIWWHGSGSTLAQVMAWCLMAPSHYLKQCWLIIKGVHWHSPESNFARNAHELNVQHLSVDHSVKFLSYIQWVHDHEARLVSVYISVWGMWSALQWGVRVQSIQSKSSLKWKSHKIFKWNLAKKASPCTNFLCLCLCL